MILWNVYLYISLNICLLSFCLFTCLSECLCESSCQNTWLSVWLSLFSFFLKSFPNLYVSRSYDKYSVQELLVFLFLYLCMVVNCYFCYNNLFFFLKNSIYEFCFTYLLKVYAINNWVWNYEAPEKFSGKLWLHYIYGTYCILWFTLN